MSCQTDENVTVRELAGRHPQTRPIFQRYEIDYCCGGEKSLVLAAQEAGIDFNLLQAALEEALAEGFVTKSALRDWYAAPLAELTEHIVKTHHAYLREALPRIGRLARKVVQAHGSQHGAMLGELTVLFAALDDELTHHLPKEEQVLFPYILAAEAQRHGGGIRAAECFDSVAQPIRQMVTEHASAGELLQKLRKLTKDYTLPADACPTFHELFQELAHLEADLHEHIHLENNILFPRALEIEAALGPPLRPMYSLGAKDSCRVSAV